MTWRVGSLCSGYEGLTLAVADVLGDVELAWVAETAEHAFASHGIISGTARCANTQRSLTRSLDLGEEGLAMQATQLLVDPQSRARDSLGRFAGYVQPLITAEIRGRMLSRIAVDLGSAQTVDDAPCWIWTWGTDGYGYGSIRFGHKAHRAHIVMWELWFGSVPDGLQLDHLCHDPETCRVPAKECPHRRCCNPAHLEPVTQRVNILRGDGPSATAARSTHCPRRHLYDEANTRIAPDGSRRCRACHREDERERRQAKQVKGGAS